MKRKRTLFAIHAAGAGVTIALAGMLFAAESPNRRDQFAQRYAALSEHNIFLKDRTVKPVEPPTTQQIAQVRQLEESMVFRGAVLDPGGEGIRAYVEDLTNGGVILTLIPGDAVARGTLADILIDAIAYERNGEIIWIPIGADLTGKQVVVIEGDDGPTTGPIEIIDPNRSDLSLEERMKLRRQQELSR